MLPKIVTIVFNLKFDHLYINSKLQGKKIKESIVLFFPDLSEDVKEFIKQSY